MGESPKGGLAMVSAHATPADSAKGQVVVREVHDRLVPAATAKRRHCKDVLRFLLVFREVIESQGFLFSIHELEKILEVIERQDRHAPD